VPAEALYSVVAYALLPWALLHLAWRARRQPAYLRHLGERFGFYRIRAGKPLIWIHAVSVGETRAAEPLIAALAARHPDHAILLTHMTPTGRETSQSLYGERVLRCYLPWDLPGAVHRFLRHFEPQVGIIMETELWPNLLAACERRGLPVHLVNARLSERSARRYARVPALTRRTLGRLRAIGAQTARDAQRLAALGGNRVTITGNLKFDRAPPDDASGLGTKLRERFGRERPVFLAASTRDGEEALLLDTIAAVDVPDFLAVLVPRHPQRFDAVATLLAQRGIRFQRRSDDTPIDAATRVVLGDTMGEMFAYYTACDIAFVGGSLLPLGGQNLLEACAVGKPVLVGPHTFNFEEATEQAIAAGATLRVANAAELATEVRRLLADAGERSRMRDAGREFTAAHRGATERTLELIGL
jgi:3-deoxy-D-manno-octulosonic-acid transferase